MSQAFSPGAERPLTFAVQVRQTRRIPGQNTVVMWMLNRFSGIVVAGALLVGFIADLTMPDSGMSAALTRGLGASSIGLALWMLTRIAR
jgi:hypothetical protein